MVILAAAVAVAAVPSGHASAAGSCPSPAAGVDIHVVGGGESVLSPGDLSSIETVNESISTRSTPGGQVSDGNFPVSCGIEISDLLQAAGLSRSSANFLGVQQTDNDPSDAGFWEALDQGEIWSDSSRFVSGQVPVVWFNGDHAEYMRPLLAGDSQDTNIGSFVQSDDGSLLDLYVGSGTLLSVTDSASYPGSAKGNDADRGKLVTFRAAVSPGGTSPTLTWDFGDGTQAQGATVTHRFSQPGGYLVSLQALSSDGSGGAAEPLTVNVKTVNHTPPPGPPHHGSPSPSPSNSGSSPSPSPTHTSSGHHTPSPSPSATVPSVSLPPFQAATEPPGLDALPPVVATGTPFPTPSEGTLVEGQIINDGAASLAASSTSESGGGATAADSRPLSARRTGIAVGVGIAVIMLLFAAGAARESRGAGRRRSVGGPR
jgi:hypothetical protein